VPLYLRGDGCFFGGHQNLGEILGHCWSMKIDLSFPIILFYGDEGLYWGFVGDALTVYHIFSLHIFRSIFSKYLFSYYNLA
jgi:hypothetical protein